MDAEQEKGQESPEKTDKKEKKILKKKSPFLPGNLLCFTVETLPWCMPLLGSESPIVLKCHRHACSEAEVRLTGVEK